jgi:hypothetical protein
MHANIQLLSTYQVYDGTSRIRVDYLIARQQSEFGQHFDGLLFADRREETFQNQRLQSFEWWIPARYINIILDYYHSMLVPILWNAS